MKEFKSILTAFNKVNFAERQAALATVVKVRGSSYRSPGARMLGEQSKPRDRPWLQWRN